MGKWLKDKPVPDFELLVLDDGSTDNTEEVMAQFHDSWIRYISSEKNRGIPFRCNQGLELAQGKYLAFLDSDDLAPPYRLKEQAEYMDQHPKTGVVSGDYFTFGPQCFYCQSHKGNENIQYRFLFRCPIAKPALKGQGKKILKCGTLWEEILNEWLEKASHTLGC